MRKALAGIISTGLIAFLAIQTQTAKGAKGADVPYRPAAGPALTVNVAAGRKPISPLIYGLNFADEALAKELALSVNRWGGNATTRYNFKIDTHNTGSDYFFQNIPDDNPNPAALPDGSTADKFVEQNKRTGTASILTMPTIGWVAKRRVSDHPYDCGFSIKKYGPQQSSDPYDPDCGNGVKTNTTNITGNDPTDTSLVVTTTFASEWIAHLKTRYGSAGGGGGVQFYELDNEPMLWNSTHRDVHPQPTSYDEMRDKAWQYAAAIKAADPTAMTLGPVLWGWTAYWYSAADAAGGGAWWDVRPDRKAHGDVPFAQWYLQQMKAYEQTSHTRILDYFDLHYYPQANGVSLSGAGDATTQALRLRSTRSLWDASYADESWINGTEGGPAVRLIPRMHEWVNANYPGTKLAISEYNWGALDDINGALAEADVLGIFGREGLDLATLWSPPSATQPGAYAFRMYRNFDGKLSASSQFGDISVSATSSDQAMLPVYAAQRSGDNALTLIVINKTSGALTSALALSSFTPSGAAHIYRYSAANLNSVVKEADQAVSASGFSATFPANSITLMVMATAAGTPTPTLIPTSTPKRTPVPGSATPTPTPNPNVTPRAYLPITHR